MKLRTLAVVALLAPAVALAAPASKAAAPQQQSPLAGLEIGGFVGYETDDPLSGYSLRVDGELPFRKLTPEVTLSFVGSLGYSGLSKDPLDVGIFKIIPSARFAYAVNPQFDLFADGGLGFYRASWEVTIPGIPGFIPEQKVSDSEFGLMMRIGAGAFYRVNEKIKIGAMLEYDPLFGDVDLSTFLVQAGVMFRL